MDVKRIYVPGFEAGRFHMELIAPRDEAVKARFAFLGCLRRGLLLSATAELHARIVDHRAGRILDDHFQACVASFALSQTDTAE